MSKKRIMLLFIIVLSIPSLVLAEDTTSYNLLAKVLQAMLNALSWAGLAIALRNSNIYRN